MSGGTFGYIQDRMKKELKELQLIILHHQRLEDFNDDYTLKHYKRGERLLSMATVYMERIDYLEDGDDSEESFQTHLRCELKELQCEYTVTKEKVKAAFEETLLYWLGVAKGNSCYDDSQPLCSLFAPSGSCNGCPIEKPCAIHYSSWYNRYEAPIGPHDSYISFYRGREKSIAKSILRDYLSVHPIYKKDAMAFFDKHNGGVSIFPIEKGEQNDKE